jgi:anti-sigma B factor antagonist
MDSGAQAKVLSFEGRISVYNSNQMRDSLGATLKLKPRQLIVDLSRVTTIDISGLATLVEATRIARDQGTRLIIAGIRGQVQLLFQISRLDQILNTAAEQESV